jgi:hypothetical protein
MILIKNVMGAEHRMEFDDEQAEYFLNTDSRFRKASDEDVKQAEAEKPVKKGRKARKIIQDNPAWEKAEDEAPEAAEGEE